MDDANPLSHAPYGVTVDQASGMVSVQAACTCAEALGMMKERALATTRTVEDVAHAVIEHRTRFGA